MTFGLNPEDSQTALDNANRMGAAGEMGAPLTAGLGTAAVLGVGEGGAKVAAPLVAGADADFGGFDPMRISLLPEQAFQPIEEQKPEQADWERQEAARNIIKSFGTDPQTTGAAGQILHGLTSSLTRYGIGAQFGGPAGGAALVGISEGYDVKQIMRENDVDEATANKLALASGVLAAGGAYLPGGIGTNFVQRALTGAVIQPAAGALNREVMSTVLAGHGYHEMAAQYQPGDKQAILSDIILGAAFGTAHHLFSPKDVDAALTITKARQVDEAAPGIPVTPQAQELHVTQMEDSVRQLMDGKPVEGMTMPETIANPAQAAIAEATRAETVDATHEAVGEALGASGEATEPAGRRAEDIEAARAAELRGKQTIGELSDGEKNELLALYEKDRLAAKVGGRRMEGVQNLVAHTEMMQRGEGLPVQGFADMDMMKSINDQLGHETGDEAIHAVGQALHRQFGEGNVFLRSGDEFYVQAKDQAHYDAAMEAAQRHLANHSLRKEDAAGNVIAQKRGIGISHGSGPTIEHAEARQYADKEIRRLAGLRDNRAEPGAGANDGAVAAERGAPAGEDQGGTAAGAGAEKLTPETQELHDRAQEILARGDEIPIERNEAGETTITAKDAMASAMADLAGAKEQGRLTQIAAACFGRG